MLEGLRVVELATYIAAPGAGGVMADWGAEVIKVEAPGGDPMRQFFSRLSIGREDSPVFELDNRGKKGVVLDIAKPAGREAMLRLIGSADIFLTNVRPAALKRAGLDYETVAAANPKLIYASLTGYGLQGPGADLPSFDIAAFWARSGAAAITAPKGVDPFPIRTGMGDHITGLAALSAILAAVVERSRSGKGRLVEISLLRTGVYSIGSDVAIQLRMGKLASTRPRKQAVEPLNNFFESRDGQWFCVLPRGDWDRLAAAIDRPELASDPRFAHHKERRENAEALVDELDAAFQSFEFEELGRRLDEADVIWSPVLTPAQVASDPLAEAAGCFVETPDGEGGTYRAPAAPARFAGYDDAPKGPAPRLGEHTAQVLAALGYSEAEIAGIAG